MARFYILFTVHCALSELHARVVIAPLLPPHCTGAVPGSAGRWLLSPAPGHNLFTDTSPRLDTVVAEVSPQDTLVAEVSPPS